MADPLWEPVEYGTDAPESDAVVYVDQSGALLSYQHWAEGETRVVSGPYGKSTFPGTWFRDRAEARAHWAQRARIVDEPQRIPGRWIFRIREG